ncbi:hypothetical protein RIEGSTA812A_PEG_378 [invertebrate metagenome]|uniref:DUF2934 domain-containing protein n=1 Tax=invertebrate metagenome TaxID=1711999 RepID=A0A484H6C9_9ZZZZ
MGTEFIQRVRERAYQLWEAAGCEHGRDMEYWFKAEVQIAAEQAAAQVQSPPQTTSVPTSRTSIDTETAVKPGDRGKTGGKNEIKTKIAPTVSVPRKARSSKKV